MNPQIRSSLVGAAAAIVLIVASGATDAAPVQLCGPTVCYEYDDDPGVNVGMAVFGAPRLLGNSDSLGFTPTAFVALAANGASQFVSTTFQFTRVWAAPGYEIGQIAVQEFGDYRIVNGGSVTANLVLGIVDLVNDGPTPGFPEVGVMNDTFTSSTPTGFDLVNWSMISYILPASVFTDLATEISLQIQNSLHAQTNGPGQQAFIQKKLVLGVGTAQTVIPVPAAAWLFVSGVGLLAGLRRARPAA